MRKAMIVAVFAVALPGLGACSQEKQDSARDTARAAGADIRDQTSDLRHQATKAAGAISAGADAAGVAIKQGAHDVGAAARKGAREADDQRAKAEAGIQGESVDKAKQD